MSKRSKSLPPSVMSVEVVEEIFEQLKGLSPQEQAIIRPVLERDLEFQRREKARVRQLRSMVDMHLIDQMPPAPMSARRKSGYGLMNSVSSESMMSVCSLRSNMQALPGSVDQPSGRVCFHCQSRLGLIFNAGTKCAKCGCLLCNECRRGTPRSKWLCQNCHAKRELMAASGEWVDAGDPAEISEVLLAQMRRAAMEKELKEKENEINGQSKGLKTYSFVNVEDMEESISAKTPMLSKRNLTLPTIATPSLLAVPSDSEGNISNRRTVSASDKFWGGSPSPRTPQGGFAGAPNYNITPSPDALVAEHYIVRERIGSPAPRSPPSFMSPNSPISPITATSPPATEVAPPTPTSPNQMASPKTGPRRMAYANAKSSRASVTIDSDKLLQPVDNRRPLRRQWTNPAEEHDQCPKPCMDAARPSSHHRAQSTGYVPQLPPPPRNEHYTSRVVTSSNPDMRQQIPTKTAVKVDQRANNNSGRMPDWQATAAAAASKPVHDTSVRRQRPQSQGPVTVRKMKVQTHDHLDVSSSESRRSSGNSLPPSRSASQEARLHTRMDDSKRIAKSSPSIVAKDESNKQATELQVANKQRGSKSVPDLPPPPRKLAIVPNHRSPSVPTTVLHVSKTPISVRQRSPSPIRKVSNPPTERQSSKVSSAGENDHQVPLPTPGHKLSISPNHKISNTSTTGRQPPMSPNHQCPKSPTGHQPTRMPSEGLKLSIAKDSIAIYSNRALKPATGQQPLKIPNKENQPTKEQANGASQHHTCSHCGHTTSTLQKQGGRVITPASSRDSLSVASYATETSTDGCTKASVASQASSQAATFLGEVQLILSYDIRSACFCVHIIQCRSLPHFGSHKPNPYVKVVLIARDTGVAVLKNKTTPRKGEADPVFDQILKFPRITKSELEQYYLLLSVWHKDLLAQNAPIGEASISLRDYDWDSPCPLWYQLEGKMVGNSSGSMSMETSESERAHSPDVLALGPRTTDRPAVPASTRRTIFRNASTNSSTSSRNSRGVRKAVLQRKADGAEEEREPKKVASRKSVELEHDIPSPKSKRSTSKESEIEDQATDWTIWI